MDGEIGSDYMSKSKVSIVKTTPKPDYEVIRQAVEEALRLIGGIDDLVGPGKIALLNPSWVAPPTEPEAGCITQAEVTKALADYITERGAKVIIAESSAVGVDSEKVIQGSGYKALRDEGYQVVDLKKSETVMLSIPSGVVFQEIESFREVLEADLIVSLPKLKTHDQTDMTCAIKKLKGLLSDKYKREMHMQGLFDGVVDLLSAVKPQLTVVDAIICQEGIGPVFGRPVEMDLILASRDLVAADATCGRIIGFEPQEILLTANSAARDLGKMRVDEIELLGVPIEEVFRRFLRASEDNPVEVEGFNLIHGGVTCTGCRNTVMSALIDMRNSDQLMYLPGVAVITGDPELAPFSKIDRLVSVGKCVPKDKRGPNYVKGCPPNNSAVVQAIIGDRVKVKRMYATGDQEEPGN